MGPTVFLSEYRSQPKSTMGKGHTMRPGGISERTSLCLSLRNFVLLKQDEFKEPQQSCQALIVPVTRGSEFRNSDADQLLGRNGVQNTEEHSRVDSQGKRICNGGEESRIEDVAINIQEHGRRRLGGEAD